MQQPHCYFIYTFPTNNAIYAMKHLLLRYFIAFIFSFVLISVIIVISNNHQLDLSNTNCIPGYDETNESAASHVIAHRGASGEECEHSFAAYDLAIEYGAKYIEQDLGFSKDGTLFVSHDLISKQWDKEEKRLSDFSDEELTSFGVLSLNDVIERYKDSNIVFVIEVRERDRDSFNGVSQVDILINMLRDYNLNDSVIIQAWDIVSLQKIKEFDNSITTMLLTYDREGVQRGLNSQFVDIICSDKQLMSKRDADLVHSYGKVYCVYTLNSIDEIKMAINNDVDMYFTNYVAKALLLESKYRR